jgi:hypothetical protein
MSSLDKQFLLMALLKLLQATGDQYYSLRVYPTTKQRKEDYVKISFTFPLFVLYPLQTSGSQPGAKYTNRVVLGSSF